MTLPEFQTQLNRLIDQFGKAAYSQARAELIWREVKDFSSSWWEKTVDHLLITCRQAPLQAEFGELISRERERLWKAEKEEHAEDAKDFFEGSYHGDELKTISETIRRRLQGKVSDSDYSAFMRILVNAANSNPKVIRIRECHYCEGSGIVMVKDSKGYDWVHRCICELGDQKPKAYPIYQPHRYKMKGT